MNKNTIRIKTKTGYKEYDDKHRCIYEKSNDYEIWYKYITKRNIQSIDSNNNRCSWKYNRHGDLIYYGDTSNNIDVYYKYNKKHNIKYFLQIRNGERTECEIKYNKNDDVSIVNIYKNNNIEKIEYDEKGHMIFHQVNKYKEAWAYTVTGRVGEYKNSNGSHYKADYVKGKLMNMQILHK